MDSKGYNNSETKVAESWARGVQWSIGNLEYPGYVPLYFRNYTGVVQDMVDGISGHDQVSGYTIRQIEDALIGQQVWHNWKYNIINSYNNETENNVPNLFISWGDL